MYMARLRYNFRGEFWGRLGLDSGRDKMTWERAEGGEGN